MIQSMMIDGSIQTRLHSYSMLPPLVTEQMSHFIMWSGGGVSVTAYLQNLFTNKPTMSVSHPWEKLLILLDNLQLLIRGFDQKSFYVWAFTPKSGNTSYLYQSVSLLLTNFIDHLSSSIGPIQWCVHTTSQALKSDIVGTSHSFIHPLFNITTLVVTSEW